MSTVLIVAGSCSIPFISKSSKNKSATESNANAAVLLKEGTDYMEKKKYSKAVIKFETIREKYPFSTEATKTELLIGEAYYRSKKYSEAENTFKDFLTLRPTNENVPKVVYLLGMVHYDQFTTIDRDQKNIEAALGYFETVLKKYSTSPYASDARAKRTQCRKYLAERQYYIGSFYLREEKYAAAKERFETIVREYLDTPVGIKALYQLGESYRMENNSVKATLAYEALIRHYPKSPEAKEAKVQLAKLNKVQHDPLAQLLMRDGRPVFAAGSGVNGQQVAVNGGSGVSQGSASGPPNGSAVNMATKKDVTFEESSVNGNGEKKGFFSRMVSAINPFDSDDDDKDKKDKEKTSTKNSQEVAKANPKGDGKQVTSNGSGGLMSGIDASFKEKGFNAKDLTVASQPPKAELPEIKSEPVPPASQTKAVLGKVDSELKQGGMNLEAAPEPPKLVVKRRTVPKKTKATTNPSLASSGVLGHIDKKLTKKGIDVPAASETAVHESVQPAAMPAPQTAARPTVELSPRLGKQNAPFLMDPANFQLDDQPGSVQPPQGTQSVQPPAKPQDIAPTFQLPASVTHAQTNALPEKKDDSSNGKRDADAAAQDPLGQISDEIGKIKSVVGPMLGGQ